MQVMFFLKEMGGIALNIQEAVSTDANSKDSNEASAMENLNLDLDDTLRYLAYEIILSALWSSTIYYFQ